MTQRQLKQIAKTATESLLFEAVLTPKPGLVDAISNGSHTDMDCFLFIKSALSLDSFFEEYIQAGYTHLGSPRELFECIRLIGVRAEKEMMLATGNVNTHKGANFSFALLLAATGKLIQEKQNTSDNASLDELLEYVQQMTTGLAERDFQLIQQKEKLSNGERLFLHHGTTGIRGEAEQGFPTITTLAFPLFQKYRALSEKERALIILVHLIGELEDSNIINRGGLESLAYVQAHAKTIIVQLDNDYSETLLYQLIESFDQTLIEKNLSPGGAADLLSLTLFLGNYF